MKIRTDFVTNSSSSSYAIEISIKSTNGKEYSVYIDPDDGGGNGNADIDCSAESILNSDNLADLTDLLTKSVDIWKPTRQKYYFKKKVSAFGDRLNATISDIGEINTITLIKTWVAWGEFAIDIISCDDKLQELAHAVCDLDDDSTDAEKGKAIEAMEKYLKEAEVKCGWPTGFMKSKAVGRYIWDGPVDVQLAYKIRDHHEAIFTDCAAETTVIDMHNKQITQTAKYSVDGSRGWETDSCKDIEYINLPGYDKDDMEFKDLKGKKFVIAGRLEVFDPEEYLIDCIEDDGGSVVGSISKDVDYLIISNNPYSTLSEIKKAKELGIPIINEDEFFEKFSIY